MNCGVFPTPLVLKFPIPYSCYVIQFITFRYSLKINNFCMLMFQLITFVFPNQLISSTSPQWKMFILFMYLRINVFYFVLIIFLLLYKSDSINYKAFYDIGFMLNLIVRIHFQNKPSTFFMSKFFYKVQHLMSSYKEMLKYVIIYKSSCNIEMQFISVKIDKCQQVLGQNYKEDDVVLLNISQIKQSISYCMMKLYKVILYFRCINAIIKSFVCKSSYRIIMYLICD